MECFHRFDSAEAQLPPGYRFHPTDEELITYYLMKKVLDGTFIARAIAEVDLNKCEPWELPEKAKMGEKEWYFFSLRDRKYPTGLRTNRATEAGYWKATGKDREICSSRSGALVGMKKTLVFYKGRAPKGEKTNWVMHEYRLEGKFSYHYLPRTTKDEWVVSRVFQKSGGGGGKKTRVAGSAYPDVGSPSTSSLPPLLDSSLYTTTGGMTTDQESCSYESESTREHVPCFSTVAASASVSASAATFGHHPLVPTDPMGRFGRSGVASSAFPSLRSLQENLQLPLFFSTVAPMQEQQSEMGGCGNWPETEQKMVERSGRTVLQQHVGTTELDCLWSY